MAVNRENTWVDDVLVEPQPVFLSDQVVRVVLNQPYEFFVSEAGAHYPPHGYCEARLIEGEWWWCGTVVSLTETEQQTAT